VQELSFIDWLIIISGGNAIALLVSGFFLALLRIQLESAIYGSFQTDTTNIEQATESLRIRLHKKRPRAYNAVVNMLYVSSYALVVCWGLFTPLGLFGAILMGGFFTKLVLPLRRGRTIAARASAMTTTGLVLFSSHESKGFEDAD
jgi:hypothetical protein